MSRKWKKQAVKRQNQSVANVAPITAGSGPLHTSAETLRYIRQNKHNPLPYFKPEMLSRVLDSFEHGRIREAVLLWEKIAERDDMLASVKPKREKDVSQLDMQVVVTPDSGQAGLDHRAVLQRFWKTCRAVNSYDRNERGGFRRLIKQMMTAISYRYAAHHIIWDPQPDGELRATFEFVPLWLFENTTGKLRYLKSMSAITGEELDDSEWMVTVGDGLMIACSIGYLAKRSAFNDWLIFSEKFSVPGVLGRTSAKAGTPEALAMESAVMAFGHDWCSLITGDDGTHAKPIEIIQAAGNPAGMPMPAVIERIDRRMAALYRGADLSSMSSGQHSKGAGASLQQKETEILLRDDAETLAETLAEVSRLVIEWHFGNGVEPLARVELVVPIQEDSNEIVTSATQLADRGAKVSSSALMERLNLPAAKDGADALQPMAKGPAPAMPADLVPGGLESLHNSAVDSGMKDLRKALAADLQPLGDALYGAYQAQDFSAMKAALRKISANMPELAGNADHLSGLLADEMASAYLGDGVEEASNSGTSDGSRRGWETRRGKGQSREGSTPSQSDSLGKLPSKGGFLTPEHNQQRMHAAIARGRSLQRDVPKAAFRDGLGQVDLPYGRPGNPAIGYSDGYGLSHIEAKHGTAAANRVPDIIGKGTVHPHDVAPETKRYVTHGSDLVTLGRKDARQSWIISSFEDLKKTNQLNQGR